MKYLLSSVMATVTKVARRITVLSSDLLKTKTALYGLSIASFFAVAIILLNFALGYVASAHHVEKIQGPFGLETPGSYALIAYLDKSAMPVSWLFTAGGDDMSDPNGSTLKISANGIPLGPAHSQHETIRNDKTGGAFSHWGDHVVFSLPPGVENAKNTEVTLEYRISVKRSLVRNGLNILLICAFLFAMRNLMRHIKVYFHPSAKVDRPSAILNPAVGRDRPFDTPAMATATPLMRRVIALSSNLLKTKIALYGLSIAGLFAVAIILLNFALGYVALAHHVEKVQGPFDVETQGSYALMAYLDKNSIPINWLMDAGSDDMSEPNGSTLKISTNGIPLGPAHSQHETIRTDKTGGAFSHWGDHVIFSLPPGVENAKNTEVVLDYRISVKRSLVKNSLNILLICVFLLAVRSYWRSQKGFFDLSARVDHSFFSLSSVIFGGLLLAIVVFGVSILYALMDGYYLPNTAIFSYIPWIQHLALLEPNFPHLILAYALLGFLLSWAASFSEENSQVFRAREAKLCSLFEKYGLILLLGLFLFSIGASWAGIPRQEDMNGVAIAGLIPFSDATGHFDSSFMQTYQGNWGYFASRRPFAAAIRSVGMFMSGYLNPVFLALQVILLGVATYFATRSVMRWRGLWAGLTFLGLTIILVRPYMATNLTEPLGLLLGLASIPYLVRSLQTDDLQSKGLFLLLTCWSQLIRPGNILFIPLAGLWIIFSTNKVDRELRKRSVLLVFFVVLGSFAVNYSAAKLYGENSLASGNLAYAFCGLTHGGNWTVCPSLYGEQIKDLDQHRTLADGSKLAHDEVATLNFFYKKGFEKLYDQPFIFLGRIADIAESFVTEVPRIIVRGYTSTVVPKYLPVGLWYFISLLGIYGLLRRRMKKSEMFFWAASFISLLASASILFADDGARSLCLSYLLLALLLASGFSMPKTYTQTLPNNIVQQAGVNKAWLAPVMLGVACLVIPWIAHRTDIVGAQALKAAASDKSGNYFLASRYMARLLVVPDGAPIPKTVPAIPFAAFTKIIDYSGIEQYEKLLPTAPLKKPFGIALASGVGGANIGNFTLMVVPAQVILDQSEANWNMAITGGGYWKLISRAEHVKTNN